MSKWKYENDVNDYVKSIFRNLKLKKSQDFNEQQAMTPYLKEALKGSAKTKNKASFGIPDFTLECYDIPVVIENKFGSKKLVLKDKEGVVKFDDKSISDFAVNGALHYARSIIASGKFYEAVAIGIAGSNEENIEISVYFVWGSSELAFKSMEKYKTLNFLENEASFKNFYKDAKLTDEDKHVFLISSREILKQYAKRLNKLMHNHNITAPQRVLYVSGMLLSMQDIKNNYGLTPDDLKGSDLQNERDGILITNRISSFLQHRNIPQEKLKLMLASFNEISKDVQRDEIDKDKPNDKEVAHLLKENSSINKQIFIFLYKNVFSKIDGSDTQGGTGHIDIMGEMYSEFLKYALGDGKELGIVLTPPYVTKMMAEILSIDKDSRVMDLATGSAGFLISAMQIMCENANEIYAKGSSEAARKIEDIKKEQLLGVELNAEMYTLAATNMILRGDGSARIEKGSAFNRPDELYTNFKADRILLNPPFTFDENGMPFIAYGLDRMSKGGLGAIIIQDSAGSGKAIKSNTQILKSHTLIASIKMPVDLFVPVAGVQTSIYIFKAHKPHDFERPVKFIDFRNDGYKRTSRSLQEIDEPIQRYTDIVKIYKAGKAARINHELWNLDEIYVEDFISDSGADWNFDQHKKINAMPTLADFKKTVSDYLAWEVTQILKKDSPRESGFNKKIEKLEQEFKANGGKFEEFELKSLFDSFNGDFDIKKEHINDIGEYVITSGLGNNGVLGKSDVKAKKFDGNTITVDMFGNAFYRNFKYKMVTHARVFCLKPKFKITEKIGLFLATSLHILKYKFDYSNMCSWQKIKNQKILLPTLEDEISFTFMQGFVELLEAQRIEELEAYLALTGLKNYNLTDKEKSALAKFDEFSQWGGVASEYFTLDSLFDNIKQGRRLKKDDQKSGLVPFVMAGVTNNGVANYISNPVAKFPKNSITVDIFGNTFYRNYEFGAGDDTGVYWNESKEYSQEMMLYFTAAISKSLLGKFSYGKKLRSSQSFKFKISLPAKNSQIDYEIMNDFIKAVKKLVIKDVVIWADKKIEATKNVVANSC